MKSTPSAPIRVCLIEHDPSLRTALQQALRDAAGFRCQGAFGDVEAAWPRIQRVRPGIVVLDLASEDADPAAFVRRIKARLPSVRVLLLAGAPAAAALADALAAGADGVLDKAEFSPPRLLEELRLAYEGRHASSVSVRRRLTRSLRERLVATPGPAPVTAIGRRLTAGQLRVLELYAEGLAYKEIADRLDLSIRTVTNHLYCVRQKLGVQRTIEAINLVYGRARPPAP